MNTPYAVVMHDRAGLDSRPRVACKTATPRFMASTVWRLLPDAWRDLESVLTWDTQEGAQRFADMNGGTVTPLAEVFDQSVILSPVDSKPLQE